MEWTCRCGAFAAEVDPKGGLRLVCYCRSCRDFAGRTGAETTLDPAGGSDLYQVAPEKVGFLKGGEALAWLKLTPKGPARWYTTCCNTPVANTLETPALPFVTLQSHRFADPEALGPVTARVHRHGATAPVTDDGRAKFSLYLNVALRVLKSRLSGGWRRNPFFGSEGKPVAEGGPVSD